MEMSLNITPKLPAGLIMPFGGMIDKIPEGWLLCDGTEIRIEQYPELFNAIFRNWGSSDSFTFNLPDLRGVFLRGVDGQKGNDPDSKDRTSIKQGGNTGNMVGSFQLDDYKSHKHTVDKRSGAGAGTPGTLWSNNLHMENQFTSDSGGNETRPKNAYVYYIIKY